MLTVWHARLIHRGETSIEVHINKKEKKRLKERGLVSKTVTDIFDYHPLMPTDDCFLKMTITCTENMKKIVFVIWFSELTCSFYKNKDIFKYAHVFYNWIHTACYVLGISKSVQLWCF